MKILGLFCILFLLCTEAAFANTKTVCELTPDSGYFVTSFTYVPGCFNYGTVYNAINEEEYDNLNVNASISICFAGGTPNLPAGWSTAYFPQPYYDQTCTNDPTALNPPPNRVTALHTSCVNESQSLCYPSTISASPNPVSIPYDQLGTTTINFSSPGYSSVCLWVSVDGGVQTSMDCGGNAGAATANWIQAGHTYKFSLYAGTTTATLLTSVTVKGVSDGTPTLVSSSNPVIVPYGQSSTDFAFSWNAPGYSQVTAYVKTGGTSPSQIVCIGNGAGSGNGNAGISSGETETFYLTPYQNCTPFAGVLSAVPSPVLATITVKGQQGTKPTLATPKNPVVIPAGQTSASYTFSWNAPGYSQISVYVKTGGTSPSQIVCLGNGAGSGTGNAGISSGETETFYLTPYQNCTPFAGVLSAVPSPVLATLTVTTTN